MSTTYRKKLIEVALPLEAINAACVEDKDQKTGHVRNVHKWFAPMPLPALRAALAASLIDDPGQDESDEEVANQLRAEVMRDIAAAAAFDAHDSEAAIANVSRHFHAPLPTVFDPFCGGGSTIIEAQRLGLPTFGSDLNPLPVLITRLLCELLPSIRDHGPFLADARADGAYGAFAADVRVVAEDVRNAVREQLKGVYLDHEGRTVSSWRWCHEVRCPNPGCGVRMPLVQSWEMSRGKSARWITYESGKRGEQLTYGIAGPSGTPPEPTKQGRGAKFRCPVCRELAEDDYIKQEGRSGRLSVRLIGLATASPKGRTYEPPTASQEQSAPVVNAWRPDTPLANDPRNIWCIPYGFTEVADLFTPRQSMMLKAFADAVAALERPLQERLRTKGADEAVAARYARTVVVFLGLCVGKMAQSHNKLVRWFIDPRSGAGKPLPAFDKQTIQILWDFAEANPFGGGTGDWLAVVVETAIGGLRLLPRHGVPGSIINADARTVAEKIPATGLLVTDPPYYKNISYSDLSDFFYPWLRAALRPTYPDLFGTIAAPKTAELIAAPHRQGGDDAANTFFQEGLEATFSNLAAKVRDDLPLCVVYALRQEDGGNSSGATGWELMLEGLLRAGLSIVGTWPVRATREARSVARNTNALASAILIVCRRRAPHERCTRQDLRRQLRTEIPRAIGALQAASIAPVDLAQAAIGPGMAIYSRYREVSEADGTAMTVKSALRLINEVREEYLASGESDFDSETRFAVTWYELHGWEPGPYGEAETLTKALNISVGGIVEAGVCQSAAGKVRILKRPEMRPLDYDPRADKTPTVWEFTQHMIRNLEEEGEEAAARLLKKLGSAADATRELAYRLYNTCERKKWSEDARAYNALILAWTELEKLAARMGDEPPPAAPSKPAKRGGNGKKKDAKTTKAPKKGQQALFEGDD